MKRSIGPISMLARKKKAVPSLEPETPVREATPQASVNWHSAALVGLLVAGCARKEGTSQESRVVKRPDEYPEIVRVMLAESQRSRDKRSYLEAAGAGHVALLKELISKGVPADHSEFRTGETAMHKGARGGHEQVVKLLITAGADVNARTHGLQARMTPLHWAVASGHKEVVGVLISAGAHVDARTLDGTTPLVFAAGEGNADIVLMLIGARADVNARTMGGSMPLHCAAESGSPSCAALLLAAGADIDASGSEGRTPLHEAARKGHVQVAALLVAAGVDLNPSEEAGRSPLELAAANRCRAVVALLIAAGAKVPDDLAHLTTDPEVVAEMGEARKALEAARKELGAARKEFDAAKAAREKKNQGHPQPQGQ